MKLPPHLRRTRIHERLFWAIVIGLGPTLGVSIGLAGNHASVALTAPLLFVSMTGLCWAIWTWIKKSWDWTNMLSWMPLEQAWQGTIVMGAGLSAFLSWIAVIAQPEEPELVTLFWRTVVALVAAQIGIALWEPWRLRDIPPPTDRRRNVIDITHRRDI